MMIAHDRNITPLAHNVTGRKPRNPRRVPQAPPKAFSRGPPSESRRLREWTKPRSSTPRWKRTGDVSQLSGAMANSRRLKL